MVNSSYTRIKHLIVRGLQIKPIYHAHAGRSINWRDWTKVTLEYRLLNSLSRDSSTVRSTLIAHLLLMNNDVAAQKNTQVSAQKYLTIPVSKTKRFWKKNLTEQIDGGFFLLKGNNFSQLLPIKTWVNKKTSNQYILNI